MAVLASGYDGPPELTLTTAVTQWTADLPVIVFTVILGGCYLAAARKVRRAGEPWRTGRTVAFCGAGLGVLVIATMSWVGVYQNVLFYARATQTVLLVLVVPLFLAMGKPLTLLVAAFPGAGRVFHRPGGPGRRRSRVRPSVNRRGAPKREQSGCTWRA